MGYAQGYNEALEQLNYEYFVLLNSDVLVTPGWLTTLQSFMDAHPKVGVCQPKMLWHNQPESFEYAGAAGGFIDFLGYPFCRGRIFTELEKDTGQYDDHISVFWASGACMMIRSDLFRLVGGFDNSFFAHMEEIDLCWRILLKGSGVACNGSAKVYHVGGATLPKINPRKTYLNFRNNLSMLFKNLPLRYLIPVLTARIFLDLLAALKFLFEGDRADFLAVIKAQLVFAGRVLSGKVHRTKNIQGKLPETVYRKSIVWKYYLGRIRKFLELKIKTKPVQS